MSTKATIKLYQKPGGEVSAHLYEEVFEPGVVYLELVGVPFEASTLDGAPQLVFRVDVETARALNWIPSAP